MHDSGLPPPFFSSPETSSSTSKLARSFLYSLQFQFDLVVQHLGVVLYIEPRLYRLTHGHWYTKVTGTFIVHYVVGSPHDLLPGYRLSVIADDAPADESNLFIIPLNTAAATADLSLFSVYRGAYFCVFWGARGMK